nr:LuxR C-terminal-related transcriptional regulator [Arthrobacter pigmenti]
MSPTSHAQRAGRAWEAAEVALTAGTDAAVVVRFLDRVIPGGAVDNLCPAAKAYAQAVLKDHSGVDASSGELVAVGDRIGCRNAIWRATLQVQLVRAYRREGRHTAAVLALTEGQRLVDRWPGRLRDELRQLSITEVSQPPALSTRQAQILEFILEGASNRNISETLGISERTVAVHVSEILARTGHASRTALAVAELRRRLMG